MHAEGTLVLITLLCFSSYSTVLRASVVYSYSITNHGTVEDLITVIAFDGFENSTLNVAPSETKPCWYKFSNPGYNGTMARTTLDSYSGTASLNITSPAAPWQKTEADLRYVPTPNNLNVGLEFELKLLNLTGFGSVDFFLVHFNGTDELEAGFSLINYYDDGNLYIANLQPNNGPTSEYGINASYVSSGKFFPVDTSAWYDVKAVANLNQSEYTSVQVDNMTVTLTGMPINIFPHSEPEEFWVAVACMPESGTYVNESILIDDVTVTSIAPPR